MFQFAAVILFLFDILNVAVFVTDRDRYKCKKKKSQTGLKSLSLCNKLINFRILSLSQATCDSPVVGASRG